MRWPHLHLAESFRMLDVRQFQDKLGILLHSCAVDEVALLVPAPFTTGVLTQDNKDVGDRHASTLGAGLLCNVTLNR